MDPDFAQRRRVFVAVAVTAVAVPAAFLFDRSGTQAEPSVGTLVGTVPPAGVDGAPAAPAITPGATPAGEFESTVLGTTPTGYLDGTVPLAQADPPMIAIMPLRDTLTGEATFSRQVTNVAICYIPDAPMGVTVTLTNLDNSRSVQCQVVAVAQPQVADVVLHPDAFAVIADITEAPVPVEISW